MKTKTIWLAALALLAILFISGTVFAEGEEPPAVPEAPAAEEPAAAVSVDAPQEEPASEPEAAPPAPAGEAEAEAPPVEEPAVEEPPAEIPPAEETPLEEPPAEEAASEVLPAEEAAPEAAPEAETAPAAEPLAEIAAEAAESGVTLVDESGSELPLTETSSAELLGGGDPYYKVGLTQYSFYADDDMCGSTPEPYCQDNLGDGVIQHALNYMEISGLPSNRMLYVQGGNYNGFTINGDNPDTPLIKMLNGVIGEDGSENTFINGNIIVQNNTGGFTLSGFTLNSGGSINFAYNSGTLKLTDVVVQNSDDYYALEVNSHAGAVVLEGVNVSDNDEDGAYINNTIGSYPITIKNSAFNSNGRDILTNGNIGLQAASNSTLTIDGVSASGNDGVGIGIWDYATLNLKNAFLSWNTCSLLGWGYALNSYTDGSGTANLENVYAYENDYGLNIEGGSLNAKYIEANDSAKGDGLYFYSETGSSRVEYGQFHNNYSDGLYIVNKGAIYLNSVHSSDNGGAGAYLDNYNYGSFTGTSGVTITSPVSGGWQLANGFFNNDLDGVTIFSRGSVLVSNAEMGGNDGIGLYVNNSYGLGSVTLNTTIPNWTNGFYGNGNGGIVLISQGAVKLSGTGSEWNGDTGIQVLTKGTIELLNVNSANNSGSGAILDNHDALLPRTVKLTNSSFDHNHGDGLEVLSRGSITAYGLGASGNSLRNWDMGYATVEVTYHDLLGDGWVEDSYTFYGYADDDVELFLKSFSFDAYLELYAPSGGDPLASGYDNWDDGHAKISYVDLPEEGTYTVVVKSYENNGSGEYWFSLNDEEQDDVISYGYYGAILDNSFGNGSVSIFKPKDLNRMWGNFFSLNTSQGLKINSNGTIIIDSAAAENNFNAGVYLDNPSSLASVTVSNSRTDDFYSNFGGNGDFGLFITTRGNVTLKNIGAWGNAFTGVYVDNCQYEPGSGTCQGFGSVKVLAQANRSNDFGWNGYYGLTIYSKGAILLTNIHAENNLYDGVWAENCDDGSSGSVVLTTAGAYGWNSFFENGWRGLFVSSNGSITLSKLDAHDNTYEGVYLSNSGSPTSAGILITRGYFNSNDMYGLEADSKGAITWKFGDAWDNGYTGATLRNTEGSAGISVVGTSRERMNFGGNGWGAGAGNGGLQAYSKGKITLGYARAENNHGTGFFLDNSTSATNQMVDITEAEARWNYWTGLNVYSRGAITVKGISSEGNNNDGAFLFNNYTGALGNVTVTTTKTWTTNDLWRNGYSGLSIVSRGSVSLKNVGAWENGWEGVYVDNTFGTGTVTFLTTGRQYWLSNNGTYGLYISTNGKVIVNNQYGLNAHSNGGDAGVFIDNDGTLPTSTVSLTRVFANDNHNGYGIRVIAKGNITAVSLTAQNNGYDGVNITSSMGGVTLSGSNCFTDNGEDGLDTEVLGAISISNVNAWANNGEGIVGYSPNGNITLNNVIAAHNQASGIFLISNGNFYLNKVTAFLNGQSDWGDEYDDGLTIWAGSASTVTIMNSTFMQNWWGNGIHIRHLDSDFWPTLINVSYLSNGETNLWVHTPGI